MNDKSSLETVLKWIVLVILGIAALKIALSVLGLAAVLGSFLLFRVLPIVLFVWAVVWVLRSMTGGSRGSSSTPDVV